MNDYYSGDKFVKMNDNIAYKILDNDNLLRLLVYNTPYALDPNKPSVREYLGEEHFYDIIKQTPDSIEGYKNTHIFFTPYITTTTEKEKVELRFFIHRIIPQNVFLSRTIWCFQILMHNNLQMLEDSEGHNINRAYMIMKEIFDTFNGAEIEGMGVLHFANVPPTDIVKFSDYFVGYNMYAKNFAD